MLPSHRKAMVKRMLLKTGTFLKWVPPKREEGTMEKVLKICGLGAFQIQVLTRHENQGIAAGGWHQSAEHTQGKNLWLPLVWEFGTSGG